MVLLVLSFFPHLPIIIILHSVKSEVRRNDFAVSKLYVANVNKNDSGSYTCAMAKFGKATVLVSVLNGKFNNITFSLG